MKSNWSKTFVLQLAVVYVFSGGAHAQDTTGVIVRLKWATTLEPNINSCRVSNDTIFEKRGRTTFGDNGRKLSELTAQKKYYYFVDKRNRKMMEGYWTPEGIYGPFVFYYKNGNIQTRGILSDSGKCGIWEYYTKKGKLKKTTDFGACD